MLTPQATVPESVTAFIGEMGGLHGGILAGGPVAVSRPARAQLDAAAAS